MMNYGMIRNLFIRIMYIIKNYLLTIQ